MKKVVLTIAGKGEVYWMENFSSNFEENIDIDVNDLDSLEDICFLEDEGILDGDLYELPFILSDLEISWSYEGDKEKHSINKKGKYIKTKEYLSSIFKSPFLVQCINIGWLEHTYEIEISDDEEFEPMKLQLIKSDYEVEFLPYGIIVDHIMYDGKKVEWDDTDGYINKGGKMYVYDDEIPYVR